MKIQGLPNFGRKLKISVTPACAGGTPAKQNQSPLSDRDCPIFCDSEVAHHTPGERVNLGSDERALTKNGQPAPGTGKRTVFRVLKVGGEPRRPAFAYQR